MQCGYCKVQYDSSIVQYDRFKVQCVSSKVQCYRSEAQWPLPNSIVKCALLLLHCALLLLHYALCNDAMVIMTHLIRLYPFVAIGGAPIEFLRFIRKFILPAKLRAARGIRYKITAALVLQWTQRDPFKLRGILRFPLE